MDEVAHIIEEINAATKRTSLPVEGRQILDKAIAKREASGAGVTDAFKRAALCEDLEELYLAYVKLEVGFKQWKRTTGVFGKALDASESSVALSPKLWAAYATFFYVDRQKMDKAKNVMHKGLAAVKDDQESNDALWRAYLDMVLDAARKGEGSDDDDDGNEDMDMAALWKEVSAEVPGLTQPSNKAMSGDGYDDAEEGDAAAAAMECAHEKLWAMDAGSLLAKFTSDWEAMNVPHDIAGTGASAPSAQDILTLYQNEPPSLFTAPQEDLTRQGWDCLESSEKLTLNLALGDAPGTAERIIDVVECLWMMQALKERHFNGWTNLLGEEQMKRERTILANHEMEMSQIKQAKKLEDERRKFAVDVEKLRDDFILEQELLRCNINFIQHKLLRTQQRVLRRLQLPYCDGPILGAMTIENGAYTYPMELRKTVYQQGKIVGAILSDRVADYAPSVNVLPMTSTSAADGPDAKRRRVEPSSIQSTLAELANKFSK